MRSFVQFQKGRTPRQAHVDVGDLKDDELGRQGFSGRAEQLYRRNDPTAYRTEGEYRLREMRAFDVSPDDRSDPRGRATLLLSNDDCRISLSRRAAPMPYHLRNVDGDTLYFVHRGTGRFETEFGPIDFEPGDYVLLPKAVTYRVVPDAEDNMFLVLETPGELEVPDYGQLGRHTPFDPTLLTVPEPEVQASAGQDEWEVVILHEGELSSIFYPHPPCDVEGWKGDLFPFKLNIRDWNVVMSDTLHLPPTIHQFLGAPGVIVSHCLPRPAEMRRGAERMPWYHRNADFDEVAFYHGGSFLGFPLPEGLITHNPQGIHHGVPEAAREMARKTHDQFQRLEWEIIAIDTVRPLRVAPGFRAAEER
jgi:homogentisate 1,2-dioxygenase